MVNSIQCWTRYPGLTPANMNGRALARDRENCNWENNYNKLVLKFIAKIIEILGYIHYNTSRLSLGERINVTRHSYGWTERELTHQLGIHSNTIYS